MVNYQIYHAISKKGESEWDMKEATGKCTMLYAASAASRVRFPLSRLKEGRFIAGTATSQNRDSRIILTA
jgi:hypothetical protein